MSDPYPEHHDALLNALRPVMERLVDTKDTGRLWTATEAMIENQYGAAGLRKRRRQLLDLYNVYWLAELEREPLPAGEAVADG